MKFPILHRASPSFRRPSRFPRLFPQPTPSRSSPPPTGKTTTAPSPPTSIPKMPTSPKSPGPPRGQTLHFSRCRHHSSRRASLNTAHPTPALYTQPISVGLPYGKVPTAAYTIGKDYVDIYTTTSTDPVNSMEVQHHFLFKDGDPGIHFFATAFQPATPKPVTEFATGYTATNSPSPLLSYYGSQLTGPSNSSRHFSPPPAPTTTSKISPPARNLRQRRHPSPQCAKRNHRSHRPHQPRRLTHRLHPNLSSCQQVPPAPSPGNSSPNMIGKVITNSKSPTAFTTTK